MKKIKTLVLASIVALLATGCGNRQIFDTTHTFTTAYCDWNEYVPMLIQSWTDYEDGEQIQFKSGGIMYLTSTQKCFFTNE